MDDRSRLEGPSPNLRKTFERILIRPASSWGEHGIDLLLGRRVVSVDPIGHRVETADGDGIGYHQYDLKLQTVGLSTGHDQTVLRGDPERSSFTLIYLRAGAVVALDCVDATQDHVHGPALVQSGAVVDPAQLRDPAIPLKSLAPVA